MKFSSLLPLLFALAATFSVSCKSSKTAAENAETIDSSRLCRVEFNGDSALAFARAQCEFGPRTPNSPALEKCGDYIVAQFKVAGTHRDRAAHESHRLGRQTARLPQHHRRFHPERKDRVVLAAHYDSRPWLRKTPTPLVTAHP